MADPSASPAISVTVALIAAGAALLGALVGAIAPVVTTIVNSKAETRRERLRIATQLALADDKVLMELAKAAAESAGAELVNVAPIAAAFNYHVRMVELAERGALKAEDVIKLRAEMTQIFEASKLKQ